MAEVSAESRRPPARLLSALSQVLGLPESDLEFYRALLGLAPLRLMEFADLVGMTEQDAADQLRRLLATGVVVQSGQDPARYRARHPETVLGPRLDELRQSLADARDAVAELAELADRPAPDPPAERLTGLDQIRNRLVDLLGGARAETAVLARPELALPWTAEADRGLATRTVWPDDAELVATLLASRPAGPVRAAAQLPSCGLVLVDDRAALVVTLPAAQPMDAVLHRHAGTVAACAGLFELVWQSARPVWPPASAGGELTEAEQALLGMLNLGLTDAAVAHRLSVSVRTVGRRLEQLMSRLNARTRFQAGVEASRRGWL